MTPDYHYIIRKKAYMEPLLEAELSHLRESEEGPGYNYLMIM